MVIWIDKLAYFSDRQDTSPEFWLSETNSLLSGITDARETGLFVSERHRSETAIKMKGKAYYDAICGRSGMAL
jgi:hypothetical protein